MRMTTAMLVFLLRVWNGPRGGGPGGWVQGIRGILAHPAAQARKAARALLERLHHHPRLLEVLDQAVHLGHGRAAARGDPPPPAAVEDPGQPPLLERHRQDRKSTRLNSSHLGI